MPSVMLGESCDTCNHYVDLGNDPTCSHPLSKHVNPTFLGGPKRMTREGHCGPPHYQVWTKRKPRVSGTIWGGTAFGPLAREFMR